MTLRLTRFDQQAPLVDPSTGRLTQEAQRRFQRMMEQIEGAVNAIATALDNIVELNDLITTVEQAVADATAAAVAANDAAAAGTAESALVNSFVANFTPPMVSADSAGLVTIAAHDRVYGDGATVSVSGGTVATGQANPAVVYIYYDQPSRVGGPVTYLYSLDEADAAQTGARHNIGAVLIPAAGSASGGYARPPGYGGIEP